MRINAGKGTVVKGRSAETLNRKTRLHLYVWAQPHDLLVAGCPLSGPMAGEQGQPSLGS